MRIVHISDIHLSKNNYTEFENNYREALMKVLEREKSIKPIDIIAITGDLVDQGGHSLLEIEKFCDYKDPYLIFEEEFILPLKIKLGLFNSNFLFIPGNHDVDENGIIWVDEKRLQDSEVNGKVDELLSANRSGFNSSNKRIELFKNFEKRFHKDTDKYTFSNNESTFIYEYSNGVKVGFALINDSWRCSTCHLKKHEDKKLYFGEQQLYHALNRISTFGTACNIILTHHPLESYAEKDEVFRTLAQKDFHLHLIGDKHHHAYLNHITPTGSCFGIMARAALNKPAETENKWQPGFHIIDINFEEAIIEKITYYKYIHDKCMFGKDSDTAPDDGCDNSKHKLSFTKIERNVKVNSQNLDKSKFFRS
ncbi:metallophosphoesterase [Chryseobacterium sp. RR2-3-20]|uniref:metallophosphoesterase family protein n=1 Tax=Chryseobacterium sp. RR2-3-20 TaxID=2787626 RepID=UPI001ADFE2FA|nr:metallophosphoesterase [Chryseobacterium sp. RR2-3-20]